MKNEYQEYYRQKFFYYLIFSEDLKLEELKKIEEQYLNNEFYDDLKAFFESPNRSAAAPEVKDNIYKLIKYIINTYCPQDKALKEAFVDKWNELISTTNLIEFDTSFYYKEYKKRFAPFVKLSIGKDFGETAEAREIIFESFRSDISIIESLELEINSYLQYSTVYIGNDYYIASILAFLDEYPEIFKFEDNNIKLSFPLYINDFLHYKGSYEQNINTQKTTKKILKKINNYKR